MASTNCSSVRSIKRPAASGAIRWPISAEEIQALGEGGKEGVAVYATYFFGKDSFAIIDPAQGGAEMIVHDKSEIGGPLNQFSTIGYKFESNGATILYPERVLRAMTTSSYSSTDEGNSF